MSTIFTLIQIALGCPLSIKIIIDIQEYPNNDQSADFATNKFTIFYNLYASLYREMGSQCAISMKGYKNIYAVFGFDTSAQPMKPSNSSVNIKIKIEKSRVSGGDIDTFSSVLSK